MRRRRFVYESPADQGGGAGVAEGVDDRGASPWGDQADTEWAKRFPGGPQEMWRAQQEANATVTRATQQAAERERELEEMRAAQAERDAARDPLDGLPSDIPDDVINRLGMLFESSPQDAYDRASKAQESYGPKLQALVMQAWMQKDPAAAIRHIALGDIDNLMNERFQSFEDTLQERLGPTLAHSVEQMSDAAVQLAVSQDPELGPYLDRLEAGIQANPALISDVIGNVRGMADRLLFMKDTMVVSDARAARAAGGTAPPPAAPSARQQTQGAGGAPPSRQARTAEEHAASLSLKGVRARALPD